MGNSLIRFLYGKCCKPSSADDSQFHGHHGVTSATAGASSLANDLLHFDSTSQVPERLSQHVVSSKKAQANWYKKLLEAWREAKPPPRTGEEATRLVVQTLKRHQKADVEGLLAFYGLPHPQTSELAKYELQTLPVDAEAIADGDTITVYVDTRDPREASAVPREVQRAAIARAKARAVSDYKKADALHKTIVHAGYGVTNGPNGEEVLAKKYRIRLRGIDTPESAMPYGKEAKEELAKLVQGKRLKVHVYSDDRYGRCVGDIHCNGIFIQVPEGLSQHVVSSKKAQANWYKKLLEAWREAKPPPRTGEEATRLVVQTLKRHQKADVEGLLAFYGLPHPNTIELGQVSGGGAAPSKPAGVKYELQTLPVDAKAIADGDTITVYVDTADPRESSAVPREVQEAAIARAKARAVRDYKKADALHKTIVDAGYRVINGQNGEDVLAKKYRIRLRGIDAPESAMPYGTAAKEELVKLVQGKRLKVYVYGDDRYGRCVGDIHCNGIFIQEVMLKRGFAWHYDAYDHRPELAAWEKEARAARVGLWASSNPEKPWEWRKDRRNGA